MDRPPMNYDNDCGCGHPENEHSPRGCTWDHCMCRQFARYPEHKQSCFGAALRQLTDEQLTDILAKYSPK